MCSSMCEAILTFVEREVHRVCETGLYNRIYEVIDILQFDSFGSGSFPSRTHSDLDIKLSSEVNSFYAPFWQLLSQLRPQIVNQVNWAESFLRN